VEGNDGKCIKIKAELLGGQGESSEVRDEKREKEWDRSVNYHECSSTGKSNVVWEGIEGVQKKGAKTQGE